MASGEQRTAFFDVRVCYLDAGSLRDLSPKDIYRQHENEKKRQYVSRVMEVEQGTSARYLFLLPQPERQRNVRDTTTDKLNYCNFFSIFWAGAVRRQYCISIHQFPWVKGNLTSVGFEASGLDSEPRSNRETPIPLSTAPTCSRIGVVAQSVEHRWI